MWVTKKPKFDKECLVISAIKFSKEWEYNIYQVKRIDFEDKWYWGWCNGDGEECGDIKDFTADKYFVMSLL